LLQNEKIWQKMIDAVKTGKNLRKIIFLLILRFYLL
jgi:hypothetical protein